MVDIRNKIGELFEDKVADYFPQWTRTSTIQGMPDFDAGNFLIEVKTGMRTSGVRFPLDQLERNNNRKVSVAYLIAFHDFVPLVSLQHGIADIDFQNWHLISSSVASVLGPTYNGRRNSLCFSPEYLIKTCHVEPSIAKDAFKEEYDHLCLGSKSKHHGITVLLHKTVDATLVDYFL